MKAIDSALPWMVALGTGLLTGLSASAANIEINRSVTDGDTLLFRIDGVAPPLFSDDYASDSFGGNFVDVGVTGGFGALVGVRFRFGENEFIDTVRMRLGSGGINVSGFEGTYFRNLGGGSWEVLYGLRPGEGPIPEGSTWVTGVVLAGCAGYLIRRARH